MSNTSRILVSLTLVMLVAACSTSAATRSTSAGVGESLNRIENILVVGVAQDYDSRARFERTLVTELINRGLEASAYYQAVGGNKPIDRETIESLVKSDGFDAVLITRVVNSDTETSVKSGSAATKTVRKDNALFRYDYQELNEPETLNISLSLKISSQLFDASSGDVVWELETTISQKEMVSKVVDEAVEKISRRLDKDGFTG